VDCWSLAHLVMLWPDAFLVAVTAAAADVAAWCEGMGCVASVGRVGRLLLGTISIGFDRIDSLLLRAPVGVSPWLNGNSESGSRAIYLTHERQSRVWSVVARSSSVRTSVGVRVGLRRGAELVHRRRNGVDTVRRRRPAPRDALGRSG